MKGDLKPLETNGQVKTAYICGALTDIQLSSAELTKAINIPGNIFVLKESIAHHQREKTKTVKRWHDELAQAWQRSTGVPAFVPYHHYDPIQNAAASPQEVYAFEREQIVERTSVLVVAGDDPSWGGGIEVGWADCHHIPIILLRSKPVSRLLRGSPMIREEVLYETREEAIKLFEQALARLIPVKA